MVVNKLREDGTISDADARTIMMKQFTGDAGVPPTSVNVSIPNRDSLAWQGPGMSAYLTTWAGAVTLMMSWRDGRELGVAPYTIDGALALLDGTRATPMFLDRWHRNAGIYRRYISPTETLDEPRELFAASQTRDNTVPLKEDLALTFNSRNLPDAALIAGELSASGPLWFTCIGRNTFTTPGLADLFGLQSLIVTGITGDGTLAGTQITYVRVTDPPSSLTETLEQFHGRLRSIGMNAALDQIMLISFGRILLPPTLR